MVHRDYIHDYRSEIPTPSPLDPPNYRTSSSGSDLLTSPSTLNTSCESTRCGCVEIIKTVSSRPRPTLRTTTLFEFTQEIYIEMKKVGKRQILSVKLYVEGWIGERR